MWVQFLSQEDAPEKEMATHSSILAWEIQRIEEPGGLLSRAWKRARYKLATKQQWQQRPIFATIFLQVRVNSQFVHVCVGKSGMEDSAFS